MWSLERPVHSARSTFITCISRIRNPGLAARLTAATPTIVAASVQFDRAAQRTRLHKIAAHVKVDPDITVDEMERVYTQRMAKSGAPGRDIYDEIFTSAPAGRCPLCMQRFVATLDHHLPKAHFPSLAVAPLNLIPACSDCNKAKLNAIPTTAEAIPLHPYYDELGDDIWLNAVVIERQPTALRFLVRRPAGWSNTLSARVDNHFRSLGLAALFASEAADELLHIRHQ
jgi:5-methylcytosine-specific restriction endonuclease McrA